MKFEYVSVGQYFKYRNECYCKSSDTRARRYEGMEELAFVTIPLNAKVRLLK